jgi:hypothetical protein
MLRANGNLRELVTDDSTMLKWTLQSAEVEKRTGLKWLKVESSGELL